MTTTSLNNPKDYIYYYRDKLGLSVFPLKNPEHRADGNLEKEKTEGVKDRKEPAVLPGHPFLDRKPTDDEIELWFKINPNYNLAIPMGQVSQAIAFDVDGPNAVKKIESIIPQMSSILREAFANTMKNKTGSGSEHVVFKIQGQIDDLTKQQLWTDGKPHSQILMLANRSYIVAAPSRHPNGNRYEWNGKEPQTITRQELEEFIRLINPSCMQSTRSQTEQQLPGKFPSSNSETPKQRVLTYDDMLELTKWVRMYYTPGNRDLMIFYVSGMMRKDACFSHEEARAFVKLLCEEAGYPDEDLDKSLTTVDRTYMKPLKELNGKTGLHQLLVTSYEDNKGEGDYSTEEYLRRCECYSRICQVINGPPPTDEEKAEMEQRREQLLEGCDMMELINTSPETYAGVIKNDGYYNPTTGITQPLRAIQEIQIERERDKQTGQIVEVKKHFRHFVINAIPIAPIEVICDPLFEITKYRIRWEYVGPGNSIIKMPEPMGPFTKEELKDYLVERTNWVYKQRLLEDTLNHIIKGYISRKDKAVFTTEIETEGLVWLPKENRLTLSKLTRYKPTLEEARKCIKVMLELQEKFYQATATRPFERKRFAHFIKIGLVSIVDFARRQCGAVESHGFIPRQDLAGWSNSGKTYGYAGLALRLYRLPLYGKTKYVIGSGSVETEARLIHHTKGTTMPVILDDADFFTDWQRNDQAKRCLSIMKYATENTNPRNILTQDSKGLDLPLCAFTMFTHNSDLIDEDGFIRRSTGHEFTKDDEKTLQEVKEYQAYFDEHHHSHVFGYLGDFAINYYLEHHQILYNDWLTIARTLLKEFFLYAGIQEHEIPQWLLDEVVDSSTSQAKLAESRSAAIASALHDIIQNQGWFRNKREAAIWICKNGRLTLNAGDFDYETGHARRVIDDVMATATLEEKVKALTHLNALPFVRWHDNLGVCLAAPVIEELKKHGITRVSHTQLPSYCEGFRYEVAKIGNKTQRVVCAPLHDFVAFINPISTTTTSTIATNK